MCKITPDYEVTAQLVTFRGESRSEAVRKLTDFMDRESLVWESSEDLSIETGFNDELGYYASAMKSYKPVKS